MLTVLVDFPGTLSLCDYVNTEVCEQCFSSVCDLHRISFPETLRMSVDFLCLFMCLLRLHKVRYCICMYIGIGEIIVCM